MRPAQRVLPSILRRARLDERNCEPIRACCLHASRGASAEWNAKTLRDIVRVITGSRFRCELAKRAVVSGAGDEIARREMNQCGGEQRLARNVGAAAIDCADALDQRVKLAEAILRQQGIVGQNGKSSSSRVS